MKYSILIDSPIDPLRLYSDGEHLTGLWMGAKPGEDNGHDLAVLNKAAEQVAAYFAGEITSFDLPLLGTGTGFQKQVWDELCRIPYGQTRSYGEIARSVGDGNACRAVGAANGKNPIAIVVPCHRVIGANGSLTGFGGGLERKAKLLGFERAVRFGERASGYWAGSRG